MSADDRRLYPVVMCGGAGSRLWPASRADRPKPFLKLTGPLSLFQLAVRRAAPLALDSGGRVVVVGAVEHRALIERDLAELGVDAVVILEPAPRDSGPAVAAAACWIEARDPDAVALILASDHHIPDEAAYRAALREAARAAAAEARIVTLGVEPTTPSTAYGYIRPTGPGLSPVARFEEKPDAARAAALIVEGCLWNSGAFIAPAAVLTDELNRHAPAILAAARAAVAGTDEPVVALTDAFLSAPRLSFDHAVMERTDRAAVLPIALDWSDLGSWDAVATAAPEAVAGHVAIDSTACLVRAPAGVTVATVGVSNLAVIVEDGAILVCDLANAQAVRRVTPPAS